MKKCIIICSVFVLLFVSISGCNEFDSNYNSSSPKWYDYYSLPITVIDSGELNWLFKEKDGAFHKWSVDIETYQEYAKMPEPEEIVDLYNENTDQTYHVSDLREYVISREFNNVISTITEDKTDKEFVNEIDYFVDQLITYDTGINGTYLYPVETLTEGRGRCADTSILLISLLKAGEETRNYGLKISFVYCDANNLTNPQTVNHVVVKVEYITGEVQLIETTSNYELVSVSGWEYEV